MLTIAGNASVNQFGWFETNVTGTLIGTKHLLFNGASPGASAMFTPTAYYGYFLTGASPLGTWYTLSSGNPAGQTADQHFAVFQAAGSSTFWIAGEDLPFSRSDVDYNDLVVRVSPVPEPGTLALIGGGLLGLAGGALRRLARRRAEQWTGAQRSQRRGSH